MRYGIRGADPLRRLWSPILCILAASLGVFRAVLTELDPAAVFADSYSECPRGFLLGFYGGEFELGSSASFMGSCSEFSLTFSFSVSDEV